MGSSKFLSTLKKAATTAADILTTKGDLLTRSASALGRLGIGSDGQILQADSTQALGMKWATAGGGGNLELLKTYTLTSGTAATTGTSLNPDSTLSPDNYSKFILVMSGKHSGANELRMTINGITSTYQNNGYENANSTAAETNVKEVNGSSYKICSSANIGAEPFEAIVEIYINSLSAYKSGWTSEYQNTGNLVHFRSWGSNNSTSIVNLSAVVVTVNTGTWATGTRMYLYGVKTA